MVNISQPTKSNSEFSARLLSTFLGTISIYVTYLLGSLIFNKKTGILAALLLAISPIHIYYSQETRAYSLFFLLTLLSMYFYVKLKNDFSNKSAAGYITVTVLLLYSHLYSLIIVLAQNVDKFITHDFRQLKKLQSWILIQVLIIIFYIPWLIALFGIIAMKSYSWIPRPNLLILFPLSYKFIAGEVFSFYGLCLILVFFYVGFRYPFKSVKKESFLLASWLLIPIVIPLIYSLMFTPVFIIKYSIVASFSLLLIVAYSLFNMNTFKRAGLLILIVLFSCLSLSVQQNTTTKDSWREISDFIRLNMQEDDKIILINSYEVIPFSYYFKPICFNSQNIYECSNIEGIYQFNSMEQVSKVNSERIWLILSKDQYIWNMQDILNVIYHKYKVIKSREYLVNQNSAFFNNLYQYLDEKNLVRGKYNKVRVRYLIKKS
jgi:uncharacterized membrane protein